MISDSGTGKAHRPSAAQHHPVIDIVAQLRQLVTELSDLYPGRRFTLDGHLVGSIGEVLAAERYGLELLTASHKTHDAVTADGRMPLVREDADWNDLLVDGGTLVAELQQLSSTGLEVVDLDIVQTRFQLDDCSELCAPVQSVIVDG